MEIRSSNRLVIIGIVSTMLVLWLSGSFWYEAFMLRKDGVRLQQGVNFEQKLYKLTEAIAVDRISLLTEGRANPVSNEESAKEDADQLIAALESYTNTAHDGGWRDTQRAFSLAILKSHIERFKISYANVGELELSGNNSQHLFRSYNILFSELSTIQTLARDAFMPRKNNTVVASTQSLHSLIWELNLNSLIMEFLVEREIGFQNNSTTTIDEPERLAAEKDRFAEIFQQYSYIDSALQQLSTNGALFHENAGIQKKVLDLASWYSDRYGPTVTSLLSPNLTGMSQETQLALCRQLRMERAELFDKLWSDSNAHFSSIIDSVQSKSSRNILVDTILFLVSLLVVIQLLLLIRKTKYHAEHDEVTGLPNREKYLAMLSSEVASSQAADRKFAVITIELTKYSAIRDTLGHSVGDAVLRTLARRLMDFEVEVTNTARLGGDEFISLVRCETQTEAISLAEKLKRTIQEPLSLEGRSFGLDAHLGVAMFPDDGKTAAALVTAADFARARVRNDTSISVGVYDEEMANRIQYRIEIESELPLAVEQDQFELYYQPQYCLKTRSANRVEALLRWQHPRRGFMPPGDFISIAEQSGYMSLLGSWIIREAIEQASHWSKENNTPVVVAVNVAANQLAERDFVKSVFDALDKYELDPEMLELEVTESLLLQDVDQVFRVLSELRGRGVKIALDDFGTGYSSLSQLHTLPLDILKIDRSFVSRLDSAVNSSVSVTSTIVGIAKEYNLEIVAEGAETAEQVELLNRLEVDLVQGYYFSKPVPACEVIDVLASMRNSNFSTKAA